MSYLALGLGLVVLALAGLHAVWALGATWPAADAAELSTMVVGAPGHTQMPPAGMTGLVAAALGVAGWLVLASGGWAPWPLGDVLLRVGLGGLTAVFLGRGLATYLMGGFWAREVYPFARLDRLYYAPLCLLLGAGTGALLIARWVAL